MIVWYPHATKEALEDAGTYLGGPYRGVLHTTEGNSYAGALAAYRKNRSAPHFTVEGARVWQHVPLDRAARSMQNLEGGVETNRWSAIQIEVVAYAANPMWLPETIEATRNLMAWCECEANIRATAPRFLSNKDGFIARLDAPQRMAPNAWKSWDGWCGHQHVPENTHWDPGAAPISALLVRAAPTPEAPKPQGAPMANSPFACLLVHPNAGYLEIGEDGGVFAWGEPPAPFFGSLGGVKLNAPITGAAWTPDFGGYWMCGADGGVFAFGNARGDLGSLGGKALNQPIVDMASSLSGNGYALVGRDGGLFAFGDFPFKGNALWSG